MTREEAKDILMLRRDMHEETAQAINMAIESLKNRPKGEWISNRSGYWKCSECGIRVAIYGKGNYCPNCGAMMHKGGDDE